MTLIELDIEGPDGLKTRHIPNDKFIHRTSNQFRLLPFNTNSSKQNYHDLISFQGITGECFRISLNKTLKFDSSKEGNYNLRLKQKILSTALEKTTTKKKHTLRIILEDLFFQDNNLYCFNRSTLPYLAFKNSSTTLKEIGSFIQSIFFDKDIINLAIKDMSSHQNVLYKLIQESLPELGVIKNRSEGEYFSFNNTIVDNFKKDFEFLCNDDNFFLSNIDKLLKYYFFTYISQLSLYLNDFFEEKTHPLYFTIEKEVVSKSRQGFQFGWKSLEKRVGNLFTHANVLELLNYIKIGGKKPKDYKSFKKLYFTLPPEKQVEVIEKINQLHIFYKERVSKPNLGWEECESQLNNNMTYRDLSDEFEKAIYALWFSIDFQFLHTARKKPYNNYQAWFTEFCKANFLKRRGRTGYTLQLSQEMILFLTKLCVGDKDKIRLKSLWEEMGLRGVYFDESTKVGIVKLFEKINLIEKKSDSGDAQYVRRIL